VTLNDVLLIVGELELNYIVQGSELLLRPTDASTLVSELEKLCNRCHWIADLDIHIQKARQARAIKKRGLGQLPLPLFGDEHA